MNNPKIVFISGPISNCPNYKSKFAAAEKELTEQGYIVLNPTILPETMPYEKLMSICFALIDQADAVYFLDGWQDSDGSRREYIRTVWRNKEIMLEGAI